MGDIMKLIKYRAVLFATIILIILPNLSYARLRDYIPIVKVKYHQKTIDTFNNIAAHFESIGETQMAGFFRSYAEGGAWGSGFVVVDESGNNYILTNRHVVEQSETVDVVFQNEDGTETTYRDCPILYVDNNVDLAVVKFPGGQKAFEDGFEFETGLQRDRTEVFSAGFPHLLNRPGWQISVGIISNEKAFIPEMADPEITYLIQHTATIDSGNSGGPLLIEDLSSPTGYSVVGVNTWKITNRENVNFSLPAVTAVKVLEKAKEVEKIAGDKKLLEEELIRNCRILSSELGSNEPNFETIYRYISYAFVGESGWNSFLTMMDVDRGTEFEQYWEDSFFQDPIQTMRNAIYYHFWLYLSQSGDLSTISFEGISFADQDKIGTQPEIRTDFNIGGEKKEITWIFEYGHWRISRLQMGPLTEGTAPAPAYEEEQKEGGFLSRVTKPVTGDRVFLIGVKPAFGESGAWGDTYDYSPYYSVEGVFSFSFGIEFEYALIPNLWLGTGLNYTRKGMYYERDDITYEYYEYLGYIQVPMLVKFKRGFFVGGGLGLDIVTNSGGKEINYNTGAKQKLSSSYYSDLNGFNVSALATAGLEYLLQSSPIVVGFDINFDYHLLNDRDYTSHFYVINAGVFVKYVLVR
jgi:hypothetical protein